MRNVAILFFNILVLLFSCFVVCTKCAHAYEYSVPPGDEHCPDGYGGAVFALNPDGNSVHFVTGGVLTFYSDEMAPARIFFAVGGDQFAIPTSALVTFERNPHTCGFAIVYNPDVLFADGFERQHDDD
jgi:hypothetical protein